MHVESLAGHLSYSSLFRKDLVHSPVQKRLESLDKNQKAIVLEQFIIKDFKLEGFTDSKTRLAKR